MSTAAGKMLSKDCRYAMIKLLL